MTALVSLNAFFGGTEFGLVVFMMLGMMVATKLQEHPRLLERSRLGRWFMNEDWPR